jgi:hypothetical protein
MRLDKSSILRPKLLLSDSRLVATYIPNLMHLSIIFCDGGSFDDEILVSSVIALVVSTE